MSLPRPMALESPKGSVTCVRLKLGYLLVTISGRDEGELARFITSIMENEIQSAGFVATFIDGRGSSGSVGHARDLSMEWFKVHREQVRSCHVLFDSRLAAMAVAVVNLVTGGFLQTHSDVKSFESAIKKAIPGFTRLPPPAPAQTTR